MTNKEAIRLLLQLREGFVFKERLTAFDLAVAALRQQAAAEEVVAWCRKELRHDKPGVAMSRWEELEKLISKYDAAKKGTNEQPPQ